MVEQQPPDVARIFAALDARRVDYVVSRALTITLGNHTIPIAGRDDLIRMKRASGRPTDLADIAALTEPGHEG